jgi:hypothetical protein
MLVYAPHGQLASWQLTCGSSGWCSSSRLRPKPRQEDIWLEEEAGELILLSLCNLRMLLISSSKLLNFAIHELGFQVCGTGDA